MPKTETVQYPITKREFERRFDARVRRDALSIRTGKGDENPWFGAYEDGSFRMYRKGGLGDSFPMTLKGSVTNAGGGISVECEYSQFPMRAAAPVIIAAMWAYLIYRDMLELMPAAAAATVMLAAFALIMGQTKRRAQLREKLDEICGGE